MAIGEETTVPNKYSDNSPSLYNDPAGEDPGDDRTLIVAPMIMWDSSKSLQRTIHEIEEKWRSIGHTWDDLKLGWTGASSQEAHEFNDKLQAAQNDMFGVAGTSDKKEEPFRSEEIKESGKPGIMRLLRAKAIGAANHYSQTEEAVASIFNDFADSLADEGDGKPAPPADVPHGPVSINYDNHNGVRYKSNQVIGQYMDQWGNLHELREGDAMPQRHEKIIRGAIQVWYERDLSYVDHDGHLKTVTEVVRGATWKDDNGVVQVLAVPEKDGLVPLALPDGVK
ncbi:hypothetical protein [Actinoplanes sp. NBRC 103695]|uniref:hypothetical protein n=1 Tax=Actinoplanes sp. NBRC 103695 TaxID=3032202 RepID=UPI0024A0B7E4|nr:hypothetical protein [Actinoplanes sp. NBRC 103695]GLZ01017.1 hypothetical protein Acsp02_82690 [Actinoplanes sp. NBRC 103695]